MTKINYKAKVKVELTLKELIDLGNIIAENDLRESDFVKVRDRKIRKMFRENFERRYKLWLKIIHQSQRVIDKQ